MSSWLNHLPGKKKAKTKQLWEREFNIVEEGLDETQVIAYVKDLITSQDSPLVRKSASEQIHPNEQNYPSESVRAIIERAVIDAEQIAISIKEKAQKEAEGEAARIIDKAKQTAAEIKRQSETVNQKETEDAIDALNAKTQLIEDLVKKRVETLLLQARQEIEKEVRTEFREAHSRLLHSLMKGVPEELPNSETTVKLQPPPKPDLASEENKPDLPVKKTNGQAGETIKIKAPAIQLKGIPAWLPKINIGKKAGEMPKSEETSKNAGKEVRSSFEAKTEGTDKKELTKSKSEAKTSWQERIGLRKIIETNKKTNSAPKQPEIKEEIFVLNQSEESKSQEEQKAPENINLHVPEMIEKSKPELDAISPKKEEPSSIKPTDDPGNKNKVDEKEMSSSLQNMDRDAVYQGEIELVIDVPVDPAAITKLYNYLQSTPDMKILFTRGSWDRGTTITVSLDKPLPFIGMISKISGLKITAGLPQKENSAKGTSSLLGAKRKDPTRIDLILKTE